ncbi:MAG TPA: ATP-binding protein [Alphaproteobacteria bacterium]|nr:ATP-binding protein [Alphaproteobacteria bacterium]
MQQPHPDRPADEKMSKYGAHTVRRRIIILAAVLTLPPLAATALLLDYVYEREKGAAELELQSTARALSLVMDRQFGQVGAQLRTLAASPALKQNDFDAFDREAREANEDDGSWISLRDPSGRQLVNTRLPRGAVLPRVPVVDPQRIKTMAPPYISNLIVSAPAGAAIVAVDFPVMRDGAMAYDLAFAMPATTFARIFSDQKFRPGWSAAVIDQKGVIVARSQAPERSVGVSLPPQYVQTFETHPEGVLPGISLEGEKVLFAYVHSKSSGWTLGVAVPANEVAAPARRSVYLALAIGILAFGGGALASRSVARSIGRPIQGLATRAAALGRGEPIAALDSGLVEIDLVADALKRSGDSLHALTTTLEHKVVERTRDLREANRRLSEEIEERRRAEEQLARAQRMEAIGQLTGGVAHDFNNLLQAVIGNLDLLRRRIFDPPAIRMIDHALQAAERGAKLTGQLLAFSRRQQLRPGSVDTNALVSGLSEMLRSVLGGTIVLETDLAEDLWPIQADTTQLELMILNLVINARDAMPEGGRIAIHTRNVVRQKPERPEEPEPGEYIELTVSDDGSGIRPEVLARVFEPFFTTKPVGKGSGLGLSQVLGLAQQQGGGVAIDSTPEQGTEVHIYLPRATEGAAVAAAQPP